LIGSGACHWEKGAGEGGGRSSALCYSRKNDYETKIKRGETEGDGDRGDKESRQGTIDDRREDSSRMGRLTCQEEVRKQVCKGGEAEARNRQGGK